MLNMFKLTVKTPAADFNANLKQISHIVLVLPLIVDNYMLAG